MTAERRSAVTFVSKEQRSEAKWTKRDKKREIKCKKSRKRKKGLTFLDGRGILSKLSQDRGEKAGRKEEKTS